MKHLASRLAVLFIAVTLLFTPLRGYGTTPAFAAVGLTAFEVATGNNNTELVVTWETESEVDITAFLLKRATDENPNSSAVVATLPALGLGVGGSSYEHRDQGLASGTRYYYWLYEVSPTGVVKEIGGPKNEVPVQPATVTPTATSRPATVTPTATQLSTATPTATRPAGNAPQATNTPLPNNTPAATNTPIPTNASAAAANLPVSTDTPQPANTPETPAQTTDTTNSTDAVAPESQPAPVTDGEAAPASDSGEGERTEQGVDVLTTPAAQDEAAAPTDLTAVDTPTAQAVAENNPQVTAAAADTQPTVARPTATPRPSRSDESGGATGLLAVIGGGSLLAAALLALLAFVIWRRR